jgi:hypothetical protein
MWWWLFFTSVAAFDILSEIHPSSLNDWHAKDYACGTSVVSIRGLAAYLCQIIPTRIQNDQPTFDLKDYSAMQSGMQVFVPTANIPAFVAYVKSKNIVNLTLLTGSIILGVPNEIALKEFDWRAFTKRHVRKWYTQNYDLLVPHPKVIPVPLGIDFHSKPQSVCHQTQVLHGIGVNAVPFMQRIKYKILMPFVTIRPRFDNDRTQMHKALSDKSYITRQVRQLDRDETWKLITKYQFVLSPLGNGMDCHRTWEILALGSIPIIRKSPLVSLFEGIPVVIVRHWDEVTTDNLSRWAKQYGFGVDQHYSLLSYWLRKLKRGDSMLQLNK